MAVKRVKVAVSLPLEEYRHIEKARKRHHSSRSAVISEALKHWIATKQEREKILAYIEGYQRSPETEQEQRPFKFLANEVLASEEWKE